MSCLPVEIEKKFLIKYPDLSVLENQPGYNRTQIVQTYLKDGDSDNMHGRIRKRGANGEFVYTKTFKKDITAMARTEIESCISEQEYNALLRQKKEDYSTIEKERVVFSYCGRNFEVDLYPFWKDNAVMEIELESETAEFSLPPFIEIIRDVTADTAFRNSSIARFGAPELT